MIKHIDPVNKYTYFFTIIDSEGAEVQRIVCFNKRKLEKTEYTICVNQQDDDFKLMGELISSGPFNVIKESEFYDFAKSWNYAMECGTVLKRPLSPELISDIRDSLRMSIPELFGDNDESL